MTKRINSRDMAIRALSRLPEDATLDDVRYEFDLISGIIEGLEDGLAGRVYSNEEVMAEMKAIVAKAKASAVPVGVA